MDEKLKFILLVSAFLLFYFLPINLPGPIGSGLNMLNEYARLHVLTCLVPAFFIAGAIAVFIQKDKVLKYLGPKSPKLFAYLVASASGSILAVCSCTILPLFAGIRKRGAGLGPAITFLFSGPAINIAAIFLTFSVLGYDIGLARVISAVLLSIIVGLSMYLLFKEKTEGEGFLSSEGKTKSYNPASLAVFFASMVLVLVVNGLSIEPSIKYGLMLFFALLAGAIAFFRLPKDDSSRWLQETWSFTKLLTPYLFIGVFIAGVIMPILPQTLIEGLVGSNSVTSNLVASIFGAFMYFSTLTEIPILQALIAKGMSKGPALALLLSGPSLSLPSMLVIRQVIGTKKTAAYIALVIIYSTIAGLVFGSL